MLAELVRQVKPVELIPVTEGEVRTLFPVVGPRSHRGDQK